MNTPQPEDDVLYEFAMEPKHDRETLDRYLRRYPQRALELIDLSLELLLPDTPAPREAPVDRNAESAWSKLKSARAAKAAFPASDPFRAFQGAAFGQLAKSLRLPKSILMALRDRLIVAGSIPSKLVGKLAELCRSSPRDLQAYFLLPPTAHPALEFKSDVPPAAQGQVTFRVLVLDSELSPEQRQAIWDEWGEETS